MFGSPDVESFGDFLLDDTFASSMQLHGHNELDNMAAGLNDDDLIG
jgi:hypothetical protein